MSFETRKKEVQFHLDRSFETSLCVVKSVVNNPTLNDEERFQLLAQVINHHQAIAAKIVESLETYNDPEVVRQRLVEQAATDC